ncbi:hypothetical protein [Roseivirga spongicola]|uniref:Uncharacterized protein n=1 Tax=Roseivirga spongicola TaxID=333140 RepID=A0A150XFC4_9BACT|nr:hypothetical protein [Roseivirga spongicola]KYG77374.1 hypothetical protein AWW68_00985 [Roseivirga spongicola]WPZ11077.1 hypothetical protein T7867_03060 [Roseivirga spongicola]
MRTENNLKKLKQGLVFLLGLFVAVFVVSQEVVNVHCEEIADKQEQSDADSDSSQEDIVYEYTCNALLPISGISIEPFQAILLAEIEYESPEEVHPVTDVPLSDSHYYKTLFRQIISPNAP